MAVVVTRIGPVVLAVDDTGKTARRFQCRADQAAVELAGKLTDDQEFAARWIVGGDPESSEVRKPSSQELPYK